MLYFVILIVFAVVLVNVLSRGNPDVQELNSREWAQHVADRNFVTGLNEDEPGALTVKDDDQTVEGLLKPEGNGEPQEFEFAYTDDYEISSVLNDAEIPFYTDPQNTGFWLTLLSAVAPILLIVLFFVLFMSSMQGGGNRVMSFGKSRAKQDDQGPTQGHLR